MNNIIDACNSYSLKVTFGGKRPLSRKNPDIEILLTDFLQCCAKWSKSPDFLIQVPCFKGFVITIKSILQMYTELVNKYETFELATGLCNQDSVEHLFSKVRQRGGFNPNPTARMVRLSIRHILSTGYIQTTNKGNVQCEIESETLINRANEVIKTMENCLSTNNAVATDENDLESNIEFLTNNQEFFEEWNDIEVEHINKLSNYDENAVTYFAGYVARRCIQQSKCDNCRSTMLKTPMEDAASNEEYIEYREYYNEDEDAPVVTKLVRPTSLFINIIKTQLISFNRTWEKHWASTQVLEKISNEGMHATQETHETWFDIHEECYNHRIQALKFLMKVKIYSRTRYNNRAGRETFRRKVKNLSNK